MSDIDKAAEDVAELLKKEGKVLPLQQVLSLIQGKLDAPKSQKNTFGNYAYRSCEDILEALKPHLLEHGCLVLLTDEIVLIGDRYYVKATAVLSRGNDETIAVNAYAREAQVRKGMDEAQITGATSSYARKYALNGLFLIDDNKDADSKQAPDVVQVDDAPVNERHVQGFYDMAKEVIDADTDEIDWCRIQEGYARLTNDERVAVANKFGKDKPADSKKGYKAILKELIKYRPEVSEDGE